MIREAKLSDLPMIVDLLEEFHNEADQPQEFIREDMGEFMSGMIEMDGAIVLVSGNGLICGFLMPSPVNRLWTVCLELYWYAKDGKGNQLMKSFMKQAAELGVDELRVSHQSITPKVGKYLKGLGFSRDENVYKRLVTCALVL